MGTSILMGRVSGVRPSSAGRPVCTKRSGVRSPAGLVARIQYAGISPAFKPKEFTMNFEQKEDSKSVDRCDYKSGGGIITSKNMCGEPIASKSR